MINPRRHNHQIPPLQPDPHPIVILGPNIEIPSSIQNIPDLLILVQMLMEKILDLFVIARQSGGRDFDLVAVFVGAVGGDFVYGVQVVGEFVV